MQHEVEIKILEIDIVNLEKVLLQRGAKKVGDNRLVVDWYRPIGQKSGEEDWYLRIRTYSDGRSEITWKGKSTKNQNSRSHTEINLEIGDPQKFGELFSGIGLERYAHQEKDRQSWILNDWKIDIDTYPNMPAYVEIEGKSDEDIKQAIESLGLVHHEKSTEGERILITDKYNLDWLDMKF